MEEYTLKELEQINGRILSESDLEELEENENVEAFTLTFVKMNKLASVIIFLANGNIVTTFYERYMLFEDDDCEE